MSNNMGWSLEVIREELKEAQRGSKSGEGDPGVSRDSQGRKML